MSREYFWTHLVALPHAFVCVKKWLLGGRFPSCLPRFAVIPSFEVAIICLAVRILLPNEFQYFLFCKFDFFELLLEFVGYYVYTSLKGRKQHAKQFRFRNM